MTARAPRRVSLDGLRAFAVVAVVLYHVDHTMLPGGFIGVDVFFVLSGYLITTLLLTEHEARGGISLGSFWRRRIRRLWPLAWVTIAAIAAVSVLGVWTADRQRTLPVELAASFGHIANWYQIGHGGYVSSFTAPSPVRHFWSLAVEEQFYLLWPLLLVGLLAIGVRHRRWAVPAALVALGSASVAAGLAAGSLDRSYLGTDSRFVALVIGAALAWAWRGHPFQGPERPAHRRVVAVWAAVGAAALLAALWFLPADSEWLPRGGFALVALAAAGVVAAAVTSRPAVALLSAAPLVFVGQLSFALYLCHWPMLVALGPGRPLWLRLLVALPVAVVVAWVLHRVVERPVLEHRVGPAFLAGGGVALASLAVVALVVSVPSGPTPSESVSAGLESVPDPTTTQASGTTVACVPTTAPPPAFSEGDRFDPATVGEVADPTAGCESQVKVLVVGDSTGRGASNGLVAAGDPRVAVWDRTVFGCSLGNEDCPDWRVAWAEAVAEIDPDVVVLFANVPTDLHGIDDAPFMSDEAFAVRVGQLADAAAVLSAGGAKVLFTTPAAPLPPNGLFFCDGKARNTSCDPAWVARWNESVRAAAAASGAGVADVGAWLAERGSTEADRPDGAHLAGPALVEHAKWLIPQILAVAGR